MVDENNNNDRDSRHEHNDDEHDEDNDDNDNDDDDNDDNEYNNNDGNDGNKDNNNKNNNDDSNDDDDDDDDDDDSFTCSFLLSFAIASILRCARCSFGGVLNLNLKYIAQSDASVWLSSGWSLAMSQHSKVPTIVNIAKPEANTGQKRSRNIVVNYVASM